MTSHPWRLLNIQYDPFILPGGNTEERHTVGGNTIVTYTNRTAGSAGTIKTRYLHKDHLGSITVITDESGAEVEAFSFDAWGKRRAMSLTQLQSILGSWSTLTNYQKGNLTIPALTLTSTTTHQGFTGHQQLDGVGLIHMGGRVYDAEIGRFLSADPFVDDSTNLQALNRYSYVQNNPLSYTDPSGYFLKKLVKKIGNAIGNVFEGFGKLIKTGLQKIGRVFAEVPGLSAAIGAASCVISPTTCTLTMQIMAALNSAITLANGGTIMQVSIGFAVGMITSEMGAAIGNFIKQGSELAHSAGLIFASGIAAKAQGGKFIDGVKGAAIGMGISYGVSRIIGSTSEPASAESSGGAVERFDPNEESGPGFDDRIELKNKLIAQATELDTLIADAKAGDATALARFREYYGPKANLDVIFSDLTAMTTQARDFNSGFFYKLFKGAGYGAKDLAIYTTSHGYPRVLLSKTAYNNIMAGNSGQYTLLHEVAHWAGSQHDYKGRSYRWQQMLCEGNC